MQLCQYVMWEKNYCLGEFSENFSLDIFVVRKVKTTSTIDDMIEVLTCHVSSILFLYGNDMNLVYEELVSKTSYIHSQHVTHLHY